MFFITQGMFFMKKLSSFIFISALAISLNTQNSFAMKRNIESEEDNKNNTQKLSVYKSDCNINDLPEEVLVKLFSFLPMWDLLKRTNLISNFWNNCSKKVWAYKPLWLNNNNLGPNGTQTLRNLTNLKTLSLALNNLGPNGTQALSTLTNLTVLRLAQNNIGLNGAQAILSLPKLTLENFIKANIGSF
jgi:hypothetical protein